MSFARGNLMTGGEDMWDDKELIRAYDKAVKNWRRSQDFSKGTTSIPETPGPGPWVDVSHVVKTEVEPEPSEDENVSARVNIEHNHNNVNIHSEPSSSEEEEAREGRGHTYANFTNNGGDWENYNNTMPPPSQSEFRFPVPPMPISFSKPDGELDFGRGELPSLLMSWYMAGYQAGFFDAKQEISKPKSTAASFRSRGGNVDRNHGNNGASSCQGPKLGKR